MWELLERDQRFHIPYYHIQNYPRSSGLVDWASCTVKTGLNKLGSKSGKKWAVQLPLVWMAIRGSVAETDSEHVFVTQMTKITQWGVVTEQRAKEPVGQVQEEHNTVAGSVGKPMS